MRRQVPFHQLRSGDRYQTPNGETIYQMTQKRGQKSGNRVSLSLTSGKYFNHENCCPWVWFIEGVPMELDVMRKETLRARVKDIREPPMGETPLDMVNVGSFFEHKGSIWLKVEKRTAFNFETHTTWVMDLNNKVTVLNNVEIVVRD